MIMRVILTSSFQKCRSQCNLFKTTCPRHTNFYLSNLDASIRNQDSVRKFYKEQTRDRLRKLDPDTFTVEKTRASIEKYFDYIIVQALNQSATGEQLSDRIADIGDSSPLSYIQKNRFIHDLVLKVAIEFQAHSKNQKSDTLEWLKFNYEKYKKFEEEQLKIEDSFEYLLSSLRLYLYARALGNTSTDAQAEKIRTFVQRKAFLLKFFDRTPVEEETFRRLKELFESSQKFEVLPHEDGTATIRHIK